MIKATMAASRSRSLNRKTKQSFLFTRFSQVSEIFADVVAMDTATSMTRSNPVSAVCVSGVRSISNSLSVCFHVYFRNIPEVFSFWQFAITSNKALQYLSWFLCHDGNLKHLPPGEKPCVCRSNLELFVWKHDQYGVTQVFINHILHYNLIYFIYLIKLDLVHGIKTHLITSVQANTENV